MHSKLFYAVLWLFTCAESFLIQPRPFSFNTQRALRGSEDDEALCAALAGVRFLTHEIQLARVLLFASPTATVIFQFSLVN
jgi:hypothetical protein